MSDKQLRELEREYTNNPSAITLTRLRKEQVRAGLEPDPKCQVFLEYTEARSGGEPMNPEDDWPDYEDEIVEFNPVALGVTQSQHSWRNETIDVDFIPEVDTDVSLVYVSYNTGSTFGRILGVWQIIGVFKDIDKANKAIELIRQFNSGVDPCSSLNKDLGKAIGELTGNEFFYPNWVGYFESYNSTEVRSMRLRG